MNELNTSELVNLVKNSDNDPAKRQEALGCLYDRYQAKIFRYLMLRVSNYQQAEDLTGEVFLKMLKALPDFQERKIPFEAWLYRIARNLMIDEYRKNRIRQTVPLQDATDIPGDEDRPDELEAAWSMEMIRHAMQQIEPSQREVIELRFLVGLPAKDAALVLDKTVHSVKALQHRGLQNLRAIMQEMENKANEHS